MKQSSIPRSQNKKLIIIVVVLMFLSLIMLTTGNPFNILSHTEEPFSHDSSSHHQQEKTTKNRYEQQKSSSNNKNSKQQDQQQDSSSSSCPFMNKRPRPRQPTVFELDFSSKDFVTAWKTSSKRETHSAPFRWNTPCGEGNHKNAAITFYGKSSLKLSYTARRSIQVQLSSNKNKDKKFRKQEQGGIPLVDLADVDHDDPDMPVKFPVNNLVLLSLWEDTYRIAYRSSAILLKRLGLFYARSCFVELKCVGKYASEVCSPSGSSGGGGEGGGEFTLGVYLAIEYPSDAIQRTLKQTKLFHPFSSPVPCTSSSSFNAKEEDEKNDNNEDEDDDEILVATRNWFYFEKPANYDLLSVPSYKRDSPLSPVYRSIEQNPIEASEKYHFHLDHYLAWVVVNTVLKNGDYDDEVFFWAKRSSSSNKNKIKEMGIMAWDYDNVFSPCHRKGKRAVNSEIIFCGETPLEKEMVLEGTPVGDRYRKIARCLLETSLTSEKYSSAMNLAQNEFDTVVNGRNSVLTATFFDAKKKKKLPNVNKKKSSSVSSSSSSFSVPSVSEGAEAMKQEFHTRRLALLRFLPPSDEKHQQQEVVVKHESNEHQNNEKHENNQYENQHQEEQQQEQKKKSSSKKECNAELQTKFRSAFKSEYKVQLPSISDLKKKIPSSLNKNNDNNKLFVEYQFGMKDNNDDESNNNNKKLEGLHCINLEAHSSSSTNSNCILSKAVVVRSGERGKAEFGVTHHLPPALHEVFYKVEPPSLEKTENRPSGFELKIITPKVWSSNIPFPVIFKTQIENKNNDNKKFVWYRENSVERIVVVVDSSKQNKENNNILPSNIRGGFIIRGFGALMTCLPSSQEEKNSCHHDRLKISLPLSSSTSSKENSDSYSYSYSYSAEIEGTHPPDKKFPISIPKFVDSQIKSDNNKNNEKIIILPSKIESDFICGQQQESEEKEHVNENEKSSSCVCVVPSNTGVTISSSGSLTIHAGCLLSISPSSFIHVKDGASLHLKGTSFSSPVSVSVSSPSSSSSVSSSSWWKSISCSGSNSKIIIDHSIISGSGILRNSAASSSSAWKHHTRTASLIAENGCSVSVSNSIFVALSGPAFAAASGSKIKFEDSLIQHAELGGECVSCDFESIRTSWTHFASSTHHETNWFEQNQGHLENQQQQQQQQGEKEKDKTNNNNHHNNNYEDNDNDGLYLSGGKHFVIDSVIARTHDDGIDSGTAEHHHGQNSVASSSGNSVLVDNTIIEDVTHEGIAFSSTPAASHRKAIVQNSLIQRTQQGAELGYSNSKCVGELKNTILKNNHVGLRYGDNYYKRVTEGYLSCDNCTFVDNDVNVLNFLRKKGGPLSENNLQKFKVKNSKFGEMRGGKKGNFHCQYVFDAYSGRGNTMI